MNRAMERLNQEVGGEWELDYDGTEFEIRTPVFQGEAGFANLKTTYDILLEEGGYVTSEDGGHVHLEALDFDLPKLAKLVRTWVNLEPAIEKIVSPYRRGTYGSCPRIWDKDKATVRHLQDARGYEGRGNLNLSNIRNVLKRNQTGNNVEFDDDGYCHCCGELPMYCYEREYLPTVEVRLHEGSLNYEHMAAWIQMCQKMLDHVASGGFTIRSCARPATLVERLGLDAEVSRVLVEKAATITDPAELEQDDAGCGCGCNDYGRYW
jgi:hypothetical protein